MKAYEIFERDLKNTKFGGRFYLSPKQSEGSHTFVPDDELKEELEALGLDWLEIKVELEIIGISIITHLIQHDEYMIVFEPGWVFEVLNSNSVSEFQCNMIRYGITEAEYLDKYGTGKDIRYCDCDEDDGHCHCHDHEHEEPIPSPKKSSNKAPKDS